MKKNTLKIIIASLLIGATTSNIFSAEKADESSTHETLRASTSNVSFLAIGSYTGSKFIDMACKAKQVTLFNMRNRTGEQMSRTIDPSFKAFFTFNLQLLGAIGMATISNASLGGAKQNLNFFMFGFCSGAIKEAYSRYYSPPVQEADICAICQDHSAPVNPHADDIINTPQAIKILNCGHKYHQDCIQPWLIEHHNCPTCRQAHQD